MSFSGTGGGTSGLLTWAKVRGIRAVERPLLVRLTSEDEDSMLWHEPELRVLTDSLRLCERFGRSASETQ